MRLEYQAPAPISDMFCGPLEDSAATPRPRGEVAETRDLTREDLRDAMRIYCEKHDDFFAHSYQMNLKADRLDARIAQALGRKALLPALLGLLQCLIWAVERASLRAQAHQVFCFAVTQRKDRVDYGLYDPAHYVPDGRLTAEAWLLMFRRINIANGHRHLYEV